MLPLLDVGPVTLSTFRLLHLIALLLGALLLRQRLARLSPVHARLWPALAGGAALGGILGARLWGVLESGDVDGWIRRPFGLDAGGSWLGGVAGAALLAIAVWRLHSSRPPLLEVADAAAPCAALGLAVARLGCFFSGDSCHGLPSNLPWAIAYPHGLSPTGVTVHPTELYEGIVAGALALTLVRFRGRTPAPGRLVSLFLTVSGLARLLVEELRGHPLVAFGLTSAQFASALFLVVGAIGLLLIHRSSGLERSRPLISHS